MVIVMMTTMLNFPMGENCGTNLAIQFSNSQMCQFVSIIFSTALLTALIAPHCISSGSVCPCNTMQCRPCMPCIGKSIEGWMCSALCAHCGRTCMPSTATQYHTIPCHAIQCHTVPQHTIQCTTINTMPHHTMQSHTGRCMVLRQ